MSETSQFDWRPQPEAQRILDEIVAEFLDRCPQARDLAGRMSKETATRFFDWIDFIELPGSDALRERLETAGFTTDPRPGAPACRIHPGAVFPPVLVSAEPTMRVGIQVESVADFVAAWTVPNDRVIQGDPLGIVRRVPAFYGDNAELWAVERHGYRGFDVPRQSAEQSIRAMRHLETLRRRRRAWTDEAAGFDRANALVDAAIADLGSDLACDLFFRAEREYWQRRNRAAQVQKERQDRLGLGWANHDHHTFRASRRWFRRMIALLEKLGFHCREKFYAGAEAGWGAQVLEHPACGIVVFADVDLAPGEIAGDIAHAPLPERPELGTVGLWCGLHGESVLQAGLHHLECQFDHESLRDQLRTAGVRTMAPFTDFPFLRQAFTEGERWPVDEARVERLLQAGHITPAQANDFRMNGAIGSHLENLERNDGYKGFNQRGVSDIIARTDPRKQGELLGA